MYKKLQHIRRTGEGIITFIFADNTIQRQSINQEIFFDERGRMLDLSKVIDLFNDIRHDLKAVSWDI